MSCVSTRYGSVTVSTVKCAVTSSTSLVYTRVYVLVDGLAPLDVAHVAPLPGLGDLGRLAVLLRLFPLLGVRDGKEIHQRHVALQVPDIRDT